MKMILFVLNDPSKLRDLLNAWKEAGADGATVFFSTGMGRIIQSTILRDDLPLMPSLSDFYHQDEKLSRTLFTIIKDDETGGTSHCCHPLRGRRSGPARYGPAGRPAGGPDSGSEKNC